MPRFSVLKHTTPPAYPRPLHYDFLLEAGSSCRTWALAEEPLGGTWIEAEELAAHRTHYLEYEGEVGGGRGWVALYDGGLFQWLLDSELEIRAAVDGRRWQGMVIVRRAHAGERLWQLRYIPAEEAGDAGLLL